MLEEVDAVIPQVWRLTGKALEVTEIISRVSDQGGWAKVGCQRVMRTWSARRRETKCAAGVAELDSRHFTRHGNTSKRVSRGLLSVTQSWWPCSIVKKTQNGMNTERTGH